MRGVIDSVASDLSLELAALPLSLLAGRVWIDPFSPEVAHATAILLELRAPRAALALVLGAGLGAAGAAPSASAKHGGSLR